MQSLACSVYFYFPTRRASSSCTEPILINPVFFGCLLPNALPREGCWEDQKEKQKQQRQLCSSLQRESHTLSSHPHHHLACLEVDLCEKMWALKSFPWHFFFCFLFLLCLYRSKTWQLFFHLENHTYRQRQVPSFAYRWLKFLAASSPPELISSSMQAKTHLHTLLVVISVIKCL